MADPTDITLALGPEFTVSVANSSQGGEPFSLSVVNVMQHTTIGIQADPGLNISILEPVVPVSEILVASAPLTLELKPFAEKFSLTAGTKTGSQSISGGVSSPTLDVEIIAAQAMGLYRAVTILGEYCVSTLESLSKYAGVTKTSVVLGSTVKVTQSGLMTDAGWTWTPNVPIFVGANGVLTQTAPALPIRRIGYAVSATQINLDPFPIIGA